MSGKLKSFPEFPESSFLCDIVALSYQLWWHDKLNWSRSHMGAWTTLLRTCCASILKVGSSFACESMVWEQGKCEKGWLKLKITDSCSVESPPRPNQAPASLLCFLPPTHSQPLTLAQPHISTSRQYPHSFPQWNVECHDMSEKG